MTTGVLRASKPGMLHKKPDPEDIKWSNAVAEGSGKRWWLRSEHDVDLEVVQ